MQKIVLIVVGLVVIGVGAYFLTAHSNSKDAMTDTDTMMNDESMAGDDGMMKKDEGAMMDNGDDSMMEKGSYEDYSPEKLALAQTEKVVLFFHADWCPVCRAIDAEISANPSRIPSGVHILKVDFDSSTALKQKYGVTYQYTFVEVDANGNRLKKYSASTLDKVISGVL